MFSDNGECSRHPFLLSETSAAAHAKQDDAICRILFY
nr:MAG TPA: hypothetical protein [Caudoviricetes sp.]